MQNNRSGHIVSYILAILSVALLCVLFLSPSSPSRPPPSLDKNQHILEKAASLQANVPDCQCSIRNSTIKENPIVLFGEALPVLVPEDMPSIPQDIMDKITLNQHKDDNTLLVTVANYAMRDYVYNWIAILKEQYNNNEKKKEEPVKFIIFCIDPKLYVHLIVAGFESNAILIPDEWLLDHQLRSTDIDKKRLSHVTSWLVQRLLYNTNVNILMTDVDVIFVQGPREFMSTLMKIRADTHLLIGQASVDQHHVNPGMMLIRANSRHVRRVIAHTIHLQKDDLSMAEAFNKALESKELHVKEGMTVLLDPVHFSNAEAYFDRQLPKKLGVTPYLVHINNIKLSDEEKKEMLKQHEFWVVDENQLASLDQQVESIWGRRMISQ